MKSARRLVAMMLAMLMVFALFSGCANQDAVVDDDAATVVSDTVVSDTVVTSEADAVVEDDAAVEETASGESANSDVTMDLMLYYIETRGWSTHNSNTVTVTPDGGTFTFSFDIDHLNLTSIGSMYIKDKNHNMMLTGKSPFSSVSIAIEKYSVNGVEYEALNKDANGNLIYDEAIGSNGVFDYAFVNQWWTDGLKLANFEIPHENGSYAFTGDYYTDKYNHFELTVSIKPIDSANILDAKDIRLTLRNVALNRSTASATVGESISLNCNTIPAACERDIWNFDSRVNWTSSDTSVATVSGGVVSAIGEGSAVITASFDGFSASCTVNVMPEVASIVKLYCQNSYDWGTYESSNTANVTGSGTYTLDLTADKNNLNCITSMYLKDSDVYTGTITTTAINNAVVTIVSVTLNGVELNVDENSYWSGDSFDCALINIWGGDSQNNVETQDTSQTTYAWGGTHDGTGVEFVEGYVEGDNTVSVTFEVTVSE